jgi:hypothetical protein
MAFSHKVCLTTEEVFSNWFFEVRIKKDNAVAQQNLYHINPINLVESGTRQYYLSKEEKISVNQQATNKKLSAAQLRVDKKVDIFPRRKPLGSATKRTSLAKKSSLNGQISYKLKRWKQLKSEVFILNILFYSGAIILNVSIKP